jgi:hypothetical protein
MKTRQTETKIQAERHIRNAIDAGAEPASTHIADHCRCASGRCHFFHGPGLFFPPLKALFVQCVLLGLVAFHPRVRKRNLFAHTQNFVGLTLGLPICAQLVPRYRQHTHMPSKLPLLFVLCLVAGASCSYRRSIGCDDRRWRTAGETWGKWVTAEHETAVSVLVWHCFKKRHGSELEEKISCMLSSTTGH